VAGSLLFSVQQRAKLVDSRSEVGRVSSESDFERLRERARVRKRKRKTLKAQEQKSTNFEEFVHSSEKRFRTGRGDDEQVISVCGSTHETREKEDSRSSERFNGRSTRVHDDSVSEVGSHDDIVLDDESGLLRVKDVSVNDEIR
jgi:hypothetical protein